MKTNLKHYGNGIYASNDFLADIARQCIEREMMLRQCLVADSTQGAVNFTTYNISDNN